MRYWPAVALLFLGLGLPAPRQALAQRGGGAHGGFSGAHAGGSGFHGGSAFGAQGFRGQGFRGQSLRSSGFRGPGPGTRFAGSPQRFASNSLRNPYSRYAAGPSATRPTFFLRSGQYGFGFRDGRFRNNYAFGFPYNLGFLDLGFGSPFWDDGFDTFGDNGYNTFGDDPGTLGYAPQQDPGIPYAQPDQAGLAYPSPSAGMPQPPYATPPAPPQELDQEDAVTVVFKDGRPSEQIHNYALTRTALYVTGKHLREIPLDQIDLPATEQVNRAAGVDFRLP